MLLKIFKPSIPKIVLFLVLLLGLNFLFVNFLFVFTTQIYNARVGLPLGFWPVGEEIFPGGPSHPAVEFSPINFLIDAVFWYVVSCALVEVIKAGIKPKQKKAQ